MDLLKRFLKIVCVGAGIFAVFMAIDLQNQISVLNRNLHTDELAIKFLMQHVSWKQSENKNGSDRTNDYLVAELRRLYTEVNSLKENIEVHDKELLAIKNKINNLK